MKKIFNSHGADSSLQQYDGCICVVLKKLTPEKVDTEDVGEMYRIRFLDGYETDAFADELTEGGQSR